MSNMRTINALYPPYHTPEAINRAEFADFIPIPSGGFNILAVHPIPETWLRDELTPQERQDLRNHVVAVLSSNNRISENEKFVVVVATTLENVDKLGNYSLINDSESSDDKSDDIRSDHGPCQVRYPGIDVFAPGTTPPRAPRMPTRVVPPRIIPQIHPDGHYYLPQHFNLAPTYSPAGRAHDQEHEAEVARRQSNGPSRKSSRKSTRKSTRKSSRRGRSQRPSRRPEDRSLQSEVEESRRPSSGRSRNSSPRGRSQHSSRRPDNRPRLPSLPSEAGPHPITGSPGDQELLEHETGVTRCAERLQRREHEVEIAQRALQQEQIRGLAYALNLIPLFRAKPVQPTMGDCVLRDNNEVLRLSPSGKWHRYLEPYDANQGGVYLTENA